MILQTWLFSEACKALCEKVADLEGREGSTEAGMRCNNCSREMTPLGKIIQVCVKTCMLEKPRGFRALRLTVSNLFAPESPGIRTK